MPSSRRRSSSRSRRSTNCSAGCAPRSTTPKPNSHACEAPLPHPEEAAKRPSRRVGNDKAGCPPFETHRCAMLLRVRWYGFTVSEPALREPAVARGAGEIEADDQVVVVVVAAAIGVFPAPGVQAVVPQMGDMLAVHDLVGLGEAQVAVAAAVVGELHGDEVAGVHVA